MTTDNSLDRNVVTSLASDPNMQRLWFSMLRFSWSSLAIVPTDAEYETSQLMEALVEVGRQHGAKPIRQVSGVGAALGDVQALTRSIREITDFGAYAVVSLDPIAQNPAALHIARATSGVLLAVRIGESLVASARSTVDAVGRDRIIGSIVLD
jgi:hypothetical protein